MLSLTTVDKEIIDKCYDTFLENLFRFLSENNITSGLDVSWKVISLLHEGAFSVSDSFICSNDYNYLHLPNLCSEGALVMYGVGCCRQATGLLYDVLSGLKFYVQLEYIRINEVDNSWKKASPITANHVVSVLKENGKVYYLDAVNKFVLELLENGDFKIVEMTVNEDKEYSDVNVLKIGKVLTKYYDLKKLGVEHIYDY